MKLYDVTCKISEALFLRMPQYFFAPESRNNIVVVNTDDYHTQVYTLVVRKVFLSKNKYTLTFYNGKKTFSTPALIELVFKCYDNGTFEIPDEL